MTELKKFHPFDKCSEGEDKYFRRFYFGGRTQCFEAGVINRPLIYVDMNSCYSAAMRNFKHPLNLRNPAPYVDTKITKDTVFAVIEAKNYGALPMRMKDGSLDFSQPKGRFWTTIHEIQAGEETGTLDITKICSTYNFKGQSTLADFIEHYSAERLAAVERGDGADKNACKYIMNSAYGKLAQNPEGYRDFELSEEAEREGWELEVICGKWFIHSRPSRQKNYFNVAMGASITGAARSLLLHGLANSARPVYCDTDSIIATSFAGELDQNKLGAWKVEATGDCIAIAGKKLYAMFAKRKTLKHACKGGTLSPDDIYSIASGLIDHVEWRNNAPSFKIGGNAEFVHREIRNTAKPTGWKMPRTMSQLAR